MDKIRKSPCSKCERRKECSNNCPEWRKWFAESWKYIGILYGKEKSV